MTQLDARTVAADRISAEALARNGLEYRRLEADASGAVDSDAFDAYYRAIARGFLDGEPSAGQSRVSGGALASRRLIGVYDASVPQPGMPIATTSAWVAPLTVPGGELPMWAISEVTVASTHRRRGIARAMIEGELRAAASAGVPVAGLTATEATIYSRYGFGAATWETNWKVDTRAAGWGGVEPGGRVQFLDGEALAEALGTLHERTRGSRPGDISGWPLWWRQVSGVVQGERYSEGVRGIRFLDDAGELRGAMAYRVVRNRDDWVASSLEIRHLIGETAEARAALWRFALQHDLIASVTAEGRPVDEALPWLVANPRAAVSTRLDGGWLRILDVPVALEARSYTAPFEAVLRVEDGLGVAEGTWRIVIDESGSCRTTRVEGESPDLELGVQELSSLYLGGGSAKTLLEARRLRGDADTAARFDRALRGAQAPHLTIRY